MIRAFFRVLLASTALALVSGAAGAQTSVAPLSNATASGAVCDGATDDHGAIQLAINALQTAGGGVLSFPVGTCSLGSVGVILSGNLVRLHGQGGSAIAGGTIFTYAGTGSAITVGGSTVLNYNNGFDYIQIKAVGAAITSATASALTLNNSQYFTSHGMGVNNFKAGTGIIAQGNGGNCASGGANFCFTANNTFYDVSLFGNHVGVLSRVVNGGTGENILGFHGGWIIGDTSAGSIGLNLQASNGGVFENIDVESYAIAYSIAGQSNRFMATHSEFDALHIQLTSGSVHNTFFGHMSASVTGGRAAVWQDAGYDNHFYGSASGMPPTIIGKNIFEPSVDGTEVISLADAANTTLVDTDTRAASRSFELVNGMNLLGFSDNFTTQKFRLNALTGDGTFAGVLTGRQVIANGPLTGQSLSVAATSTVAPVMNIVDTNGHIIESCFPGGTRALNTCSFGNITLYADDAGTLQKGVVSGVTGQIEMAGQVYPGTGTTMQTGGGLLAGAGNPASGQGNNGDFYFRTNCVHGTASCTWHKEAGVWQALN